MANGNVYGGVKDRRGRILPLHNSATTEATLDEVLTDSSLVGSQQSLGTYGDQLGNYVVASGGISMETDSTYNFVRSAGVIKAVFPQ